MTVRTPPTFLQAGAHTAENTRLAQMGQWGSEPASFSGGISAVDAGHGVVRIGSTQLEVTENGTPNMSVNVAAGACFIRGTESASQGVYHFFNDATVNLSIDAADPTNGRKDLIVAQVRDSGYSGSNDDARLFVVKGTAAGSPADPTVPANCLVLARVTVAAAASSIVTANITDLRTYARPWNTAWGHVASATKTANQTFATTSYVDATNLTVTFTALAGRRYKVQVHALAVQDTSTDFAADIILADGSNTQLARSIEGLSFTNDSGTMSITHVATATGSTTWKVRGRVNTAAKAFVMSCSSTSPALLLVEDIGPA